MGALRKNIRDARRRAYSLPNAENLTWYSGSAQLSLLMQFSVGGRPAAKYHRKERWEEGLVSSVSVLALVHIGLGVWTNQD